MASTYDWTDFDIFDDDCILDAASLGAADLDQACAKFDAWLDSLRGLDNKPNHCGIPGGRVDNVKELLTKFFPPNLPFVNIAYQTLGDNPRYHPDPVTVPFGNDTIDINDGPSALAYIFSIAKQPAPKSGQPPLPAKNFFSYGLPLLTVFSRWVYLAYCKQRNSLQIPLGRPEGMVPFMSCIMYMIDNDGNFRFFLGSTYVTQNADPMLFDDGFQKRRIMNIWRRQNVLNTNHGLAYFNPSRVDNLPNLCPVMVEPLCKAYLKLLRGNESVRRPGMTLYKRPDPNNAGAPREPTVIKHTPSLDVCMAVFTATSAIMQLAWTTAGKTMPIKPMPLDSVTSMKALKTQIRKALVPIIHFRFDPPGVYNRQDARLRGLFFELIRAYYMPHMFRSTGFGDADIAGREQVIPEFTGIIDAATETFWDNHGDAMLQELDDLHYWVTTLDDRLADGGPGVPRFGRCAETHPLVAIMPALTPTRVLPAPNNPNNETVTPVHGIAFSIRKFTNDAGNLLAASFTSDTLDGIHSPASQLYRKPCDNCHRLLPELDVTVGQENYDQDLYALYPNAGKGVSLGSSSEIGFVVWKRNVYDVTLVVDGGLEGQDAFYNRRQQLTYVARLKDNGKAKES